MSLSRNKKKKFLDTMLIKSYNIKADVSYLYIVHNRIELGSLCQEFVHSQKRNFF